MHGWRWVEEWIPKHCGLIGGQKDDAGLSSQVGRDVLGTNGRAVDVSKGRDRAGPGLRAKAGGLRTGSPGRQDHLPSRARAGVINLCALPSSPGFIKVLAREISSEIEIEV